MSKTAVEAARAGTVFALRPEDKRFVLVNDKTSPLYDERLELPVSEELAMSIAREGQIQSAKCRKNGDRLEILDGRQRFRAVLLVNEWVRGKDARVAFRAGVEAPFKFEVVRPEDEKDAVRKMLAANLRIEETPIIRARRIARAMKWGLTEEEIRISYGFKSASTITGILALLDCCPAVQSSVEKGELPETVARRFVGLDHKKQAELLAEMREKGVMRGASASRAVTEKKNGHAISDATMGAKKMLPREFLESYGASLADVKVPGAAVVRANLKFVLGETAALGGSEMAPYREAAARARR